MHPHGGDTPNVCEKCAKGMYQKDIGQTKCEQNPPCPGGEYTYVVGTASTRPLCKHCPPGRYKQFPSPTVTDEDIYLCMPHTPCAKGKFTAEPGSTTEEIPVCKDCAPGRYRSNPADSSMVKETAQTACAAHAPFCVV